MSAVVSTGDCMQGYCDVDSQSVSSGIIPTGCMADETLFERVLNDERHVLHSLR